MKQKVKTAIIVITSCILLILHYYYYYFHENGPQNSSFNKSNVIFDINADLKPFELYDQIQCRNSKKIADIETKLCVHKIEDDVYISRNIWENGVYEAKVIEMFLNALKRNPNAIAFDIGANVGQYTLFAAKLGHDVITVEPFIDNILRIHKAAKLERTEHKIRVLKTALSNERNQLKMLRPLYKGAEQNNIGAKGLKMEKETIMLNELDEHSTKYLAITMLMDDLVDYLPSSSSSFKLKGVMKIDIEGFESYAFEHAKVLFDKVEIQHVLMEWGNLKKMAEESSVENMVEFLISHNLQPFDYQDKPTLLKKENWRNWPWNIQWIRNSNRKLNSSQIKTSTLLTSFLNSLFFFNH